MHISPRYLHVPADPGIATVLCMYSGSTLCILKLNIRFCSQSNKVPLSFEVAHTPYVRYIPRYPRYPGYPVLAPKTCSKTLSGQGRGDPRAPFLDIVARLVLKSLTSCEEVDLLSSSQGALLHNQRNYYPQWTSSLISDQRAKRGAGCDHRDVTAG